MGTKGKKNDGRTADLTCGWFTRAHGAQWEAWRAYADEWLHQQNRGLDVRRKAIAWFLESYLAGEGLPCEPPALFASDAALPDLMGYIEKTVRLDAKYQRHNVIVEFLDWVIAKDFTELNDHGVPVALVANPFSKVTKGCGAVKIESVHNPLPYTFIRELRAILCPDPKGHFSDWLWAQEQSGQRACRPGDWFEVDPGLVDRTDPDCVWRERALTRRQKAITITELWSPVRAVALFVKLHLPLRTFQLRMLDSGEADTWRYEQRRWGLERRHPFASGSEKAPWQRGVFRRIRVPNGGEVMTGLYISTNKSADQNKDAPERGYTIPWEHPEVLYWLEKLRNWQERYNPIDAPVPWAKLQVKHLQQIRSAQTLEAMGESCFLFRDASAYAIEDRAKPVQDHALARLWYQLLLSLEDRVATRGQTLSDGSPLRFVKDYSDQTRESERTATKFPLHSLRVSLITCYAMDGEVPLPVLSKLLAGHSRILMTIYYTKITPAVIRQRMAQAEVHIDAKADESMRAFLEDAEFQQIQAKTAFRDIDSIQAILANRNPVGWEHRHIGLCLAGGNTGKSADMLLAGCWNGGELLTTRGNAGDLYGAVAHGPENCVRCRWFITDARYLDALRAHFNNLSYHASQAAALAVEREQELEALQDARYTAEQAGRPFLQHAEVQAAERRYDKQLVEADEYAKDLRACFTLIHRIIAIETGREDGDNRQKLVAVGALHDIHHPLALLESDCELWQLAEICEDAEVYPDLEDDLRKTAAVETRSRVLNLMLMREGYAPVFLQMDDQMQLIMGNALLRAMATQACPDDYRIEGMRRVAGIIEAERSLRESGLLQHGIDALEQHWRNPVMPLSELTGQSRKARLEVVRDDH